MMRVVFQLRRGWCWSDGLGSARWTTRTALKVKNRGGLVAQVVVGVVVVVVWRMERGVVGCGDWLSGGGVASLRGGNGHFHS